MTRALAALFAIAVALVFFAHPQRAAAQVYCCAVRTAPTPTPTPGPNTIKHVIVIVQENRSFNNLFNGYPGATTSTTYTTSAGGTASLNAVALGGEPGDPSHAHIGPSGGGGGCGAANGTGRASVLSCGGYITDCDASVAGGAPFTCANDGWDQGQPNAALSTILSYVSYTGMTTDSYWNIANNYMLADETFQGNEGPSLPAHLYLIGGQSYSCVVSGTACLTIGSPPQAYIGENTTPVGCENPGGAARTIPMTTSWPGDENLPGGSTWLHNTAVANVNGCTDFQTIFDLANNKGVSWRWYTPAAVNASGIDGYWQPVHEIAHHCGAVVTGNCTGADMANVVTPALSSLLNDITNHTLAAITYISPTQGLSDHPTFMPACTAAPCPSVAYVASIVNAIGQSAFYWTTQPTTVIVVWDDWGGEYDPVVPPRPSFNTSDPYEYGYRVPMLVVSPYLKTAGAVDHTVSNFARILHYIETTFGLPSLNTAAQAFCTAHTISPCNPTLDSTADDMTACCFNFNRTPLSYTTVYNPPPKDRQKILGVLFASETRGNGVADGGPLTPRELELHGAADEDYLPPKVLQRDAMFGEAWEAVAGAIEAARAEAAPPDKP
jgi:phospholipase C